MKKKSTTIIYSIAEVKPHNAAWREELCKQIEKVVGVMRVLSSAREGLHTVEITIEFDNDAEAIATQKSIMKITKRGNGKEYTVIGRKSNLSELYNPNL